MPSPINPYIQENSQKEKDHHKLRLEKEKLEDLIANPGFKTYQTILGDENITVTYKLCPVCSDLHTFYHKSIALTDDDPDNQGWE